MVLYYSATGNTEYIAKEIAKQTDDEAQNLLERIRKKDRSQIFSEKPFVICSPVHVCEPPMFFMQYLKDVTLSGNRNVYFVFTSGGYAGISAHLARNIIKRKGMTYMGRAEFTMPRNYPISRRYPLLSDEENAKRISQAMSMIPKVCDAIRSGAYLKARRITYFEKIITLPFTPLWVKFKHKSDLFRSTDKCIGCGKCTLICPLNNISLSEGRPAWANECSHCMACYANCPTGAIEYGDITVGKPRYRFLKKSP